MTKESSYFVSANRSKKSVVVNLAHPEGQNLIKALAAKSDVLVENFKVGGLKKYGLDFDSIHKVNPRLVYCSITGFGQNGPRAQEPGYDFMIQGSPFPLHSHSPFSSLTVLVLRSISYLTLFVIDLT